MPSALTDLRAPTPDLFVLSHSGARAGGPMLLLRFLRWLDRATNVRTRVVLLHGGHMEDEFKELGARVLGGSGSRLWMLQRGLGNVGFSKPESALALARFGPTMYAHRHVPVIFLNSVGALPALQFLPADAPGKVVLYVHEMEMGFERTIGPRVWARLAPRVDHFVTCAEAVTDLLVAKGIDRSRITCHRGFIEPVEVEPLRVAHLRKSLGIPPDAFVVGASGRPDWRKAPEVFVRLAATLDRLRGNRDVHYVWVGGPMEGSPRWKLLHDAEGVGLHGRLHLTDEIDDPTEVTALFDAFALTSREDSYPLAMLEAAALGVPIVSFANGGVTELAAAGGDEPLVVVVPYLDVEAMALALSELCDDPGRRAKLAERAQAHVLSTHMVDQAAPRLFETLAQLAPGLSGKAWTRRKAPGA